MSAKKFTIITVSVIFVFFVSCFVFWETVVSRNYNLDELNDGHGDLARMASMQISPARNPQAIYNKKHLEFPEYLTLLKQGEHIQIDILTIGDSFSNGGAGAYYQDYLMEQLNVNVLNMPTIPGYRHDAIRILDALEVTGYLDIINPKLVILESVERKIGSRWGERIVFDSTMDAKRLEEAFLPTNNDVNEGDSEKPLQGIIPQIMIQADWKYLNDRYIAPQSRLVKFYNLNKACFTNPGCEDMLLILDEDLESAMSPVDSKMVNENMNMMANRMKEKNIEMMFLPCPDKFDLYFPYIVNPPVDKESLTIEEIESLPKEYFIIPAKRLLRKAMDKGEMDLYWADDTHWSWIAFQLVIDNIMPEVRLALEM